MAVNRNSILSRAVAAVVKRPNLQFLSREIGETVSQIFETGKSS
jgi:hypothetical protein